MSLHKELEPNFNLCIKKNLIVIIMFTPQNVGTLVPRHKILVQIHYCIHLFWKIAANQTKQQNQRKERSNFTPQASQREHLNA
jgi:hypothetical protein